jgi:hypothetical protein
MVPRRLQWWGPPWGWVFEVPALAALAGGTPILVAARVLGTAEGCLLLWQQQRPYHRLPPVLN